MNSKVKDFFVKEITKKNLANYIDHTLLKPEATKAQVRKICEEALEFGFFGVCVNSSMVGVCREVLRGTKINIISVVGFPLGAADSSTKAFETTRALNLGATEIDMVLHLGLFKAKEYSLAERDIQDVVRSAEGKKVKVIIETAMLSNDEKKRACELAITGGAHFVKTCTGFNGGAATVEDIELMKSVVSDKCQIKASGGIRDFDFALSLIAAGANRLGTSFGVALIGSAPSDLIIKPGDY
jgi:deoxyribose-phosphate aldolase